METTENNTPIKNFWKNTILPLGFWMFLLMGGFFAWCFFQTANNLEIANTHYDELSKKMSATNTVLSKQTFKADSMNRILTGISDYMPMASTLQYRDSVCGKLTHQSGDVVLMKPDSSKWVIIAVSIKGSKWQHTVNYILRDKTGKQVEVEPETLY